MVLILYTANPQLHVLSALCLMYVFITRNAIQALQECSRPFQSLQQSIVKFCIVNIFVSYGITIEDNANLVGPANLTVNNTLRVQLTRQSQHELYTEILQVCYNFQTKEKSHKRQYNDISSNILT